MAFRKILIVCKQNHPGARALGERIFSWLLDKGLDPEIINAQVQYNFASLPDLVLVLGGDGTILGMARCLAGTATPLFGINFGRVGFLAALDADAWQPALEAAIAGEPGYGSYLALTWELWRGDANLQSGIAINDVVVGRGCLARLTTLDLAVNGKSCGEVRSDGLIVSSPLGSSGYFVSAGGAAIDPQLEAMGVIAICPFLSSLKPLILPGSAAIVITVSRVSNDCFLTIDGQIGFPLQKLDRVLVRGRPRAIHFWGGIATPPGRRLSCFGATHRGQE